MLVVCGESFETQEWLKRVVQEEAEAILVLLAPVDFDVHPRTAIDLCNWPSRTADKTLVTLVDSLKKGRHGTFEAASRPQPPTTAAPSWFSENRTGVILLLAVLAGPVALVSVAPQQVAPTPRAEATVTAQPQRTLTASRTNADGTDKRQPTIHNVEERHEPESSNEEGYPAIIPDTGCNGEFGFGCTVFSCDKTLHTERPAFASQ